MKHKGDRETSFIDKNVSAWLEANRDTDGLCLRRFHADFVIDLEGRNAGDIVEIGSQDAGETVEISAQDKGDFIEIQGDYNSVTRVNDADKRFETLEKYEITSIGKRCFEECELLKEQGEPCPLKTGVAFGKKV